MGGHLMGQKVTDQVAEMRSLPSGIDQRSPARHPDWLGPDDLFLKVQELRELTKNKVPIQLKLGAAKVYDDVRMAAKCNPDSIFLDGMEGSTGAGPHIAAANTGIPGIAAIREARRALDDVGKTGKVTLIYAGGVRDGADMAKALALGADAIAIGTGALIALNCNKDIPEANFEKEMGVKAGQCYHCHTGRCPVGVATQDPILRKRLNPDDAALRVYNYLHAMTLKYVEAMGWDDLNWLEDVHMGYEEGRPAVFCRNANGWVTIPKKIKLPNNQQDRDMIARELLVKFQMSPNHPLVDLKKAYLKF
jgi:glutamate synthase domain-containing protein 2